MHGVCRRQVQCGRRRRLQELPGEFELTCAEHSFEQVHLQRGVVGGKWRRMHGVRRRKVQERGRRCELHELPGGVKLACTEHISEQLQTPAAPGLLLWPSPWLGMAPLARPGQL